MMSSAEESANLGLIKNWFKLFHQFNFNIRQKHTWPAKNWQLYLPSSPKPLTVPVIWPDTSPVQDEAEDQHPVQGVLVTNPVTLRLPLLHWHRNQQMESHQGPKPVSHPTNYDISRPIQLAGYAIKAIFGINISTICNAHM